MARQASVALLCALMAVCAVLLHTASALPADFVKETVWGQVATPVSAVLFPDGSERVLVLQQFGIITIVDPAQSDKKATYMTMTNVNFANEKGLLDCAFDPNFATNKYFYCYFTPQAPSRARISRFTHKENSGGTTSRGQLGSETILWEDITDYVRWGKESEHDFQCRGLNLSSYATAD
eukprot:m.202311 g.202311  ORF g.202311 m.202311 type:complete len:179 (-) comp14977_c1_seq2:821-1357(-)